MIVILSLELATCRTLQETFRVIPWCLHFKHVFSNQIAALSSNRQDIICIQYTLHMQESIWDVGHLWRAQVDARFLPWAQFFLQNDSAWRNLKSQAQGPPWKHALPPHIRILITQIQHPNECLRCGMEEAWTLKRSLGQLQPFDLLHLGPCFIHEVWNHKDLQCVKAQNAKGTSRVSCNLKSSELQWSLNDCS